MLNKSGCAFQCLFCMLCKTGVISAAAMMSKETWLTWYWYLRVSLTRVWLSVIFSLSCSVFLLLLLFFPAFLCNFSPCVFQTPRIRTVLSGETLAMHLWRQQVNGSGLETTIFRLAVGTSNLDYFLFVSSTFPLLAAQISFLLFCHARYNCSICTGP